MTVTIPESDETIRQLLHLFLFSNGPTSSSFLLSSLDDSTSCDILIENRPLITRPSSKILLLNTDAVPLPQEKDSGLVVSYGLNHFATVTASSLREDVGGLSFQYCLQRSIISPQQKELELQEFPVCIDGFLTDIHSALAFVTLALLTGTPSDQLFHLHVK